MGRQRKSLTSHSSRVKVNNLRALYRLYISTLISYIPRFCFSITTENPISSKADEGKSQLPKQKEGFREVKENQVQKNRK